VIRATGLLLFLATLAMPIHGCRAHPRDFEPSAQARAPKEAAPREIPPAWRKIEARARSGWVRDGAWGAVWSARAWYPYFLAPVWVAALLLARRGASARRAVARSLLVLSAAIAAFEARYLWTEYDELFRGLPQGLETGVAWLLVCAVLFWRPLRREDPVGATVSAQALLGTLHAFTFLFQDARLWLSQGHGAGPIARALLANYQPGYWLAVAGLALAAAPGYAPLLARARVPRASPDLAAAQVAPAAVGATGGEPT
jgi:hypothetical protein